MLLLALVGLFFLPQSFQNPAWGHGQIVHPDPNQKSRFGIQTNSFLAGGLGDLLQQFAFLISQITDVSFELHRITTEQSSVESARC